MTVEDLAEAAGLSSDYVSKLEAGKHSPTAETLVKLAAALDVDPGELFPPSARGDGPKRVAIDELVAFVSRYRSVDIAYCVDVLRVVMEQRPRRLPTKKKPPRAKKARNV